MIPLVVMLSLSFLGGDFYDFAINFDESLSVRKDD